MNPQAAPHSPAQPDPPAQPVGPAKKSGGGCMKGCLGCGCASIILLVLLTMVGGAVWWWQGPKLSRGMTESFAVVEKLSGGGSSRSGAGFDLSNPGALDGSAGEGSSGSAQLARADAAERFLDRLERPMAKKDIQQVQSALESWEKTRAVKRFESVIENLEGLSNDNSVMTNFHKVRHGVSLVFRIHDISEQYPSHVKKNGGEKLVQNQSQLLAIYRASQLAASGSEYEPWEQPIADALIEDHDKNQGAYKELRQRLRELSEQGQEYFEALSQEEQAEIMELYVQQFTLLPSAINRTSLKNWAALSDKERQQTGERFDSPVGRLTRLVGGSMSGEDGENADWLFLELMGP